MRIIFVRHGHPNYEKDCLTELGHRHAEAAALRLRNEGVERIYSSTCGRAFETAQHLGDLIGLPVVADGVEIGKLTDVLIQPGNDVYVVKGKHEYLIPAVKEYVEPLDPSEGVVRVHLIEGMQTDAN